MLSAGGPTDLCDKEVKEGVKGRGERRRSQNFKDLCKKFDGEREMSKDDGKSQSVKFRTQSEDTNISVGVSKKEIMVSQQSTTFSSLREIWEPRENLPARRPVLIQRKIVVSEQGFSLVRTSTNKRKGEIINNVLAGKRNRPG